MKLTLEQKVYAAKAQNLVHTFFMVCFIHSNVNDTLADILLTPRGLEKQIISHFSWILESAYFQKFEPLYKEKYTQLRIQFISGNVLYQALHIAFYFRQIGPLVLKIEINMSHFCVPMFPQTFLVYFVSAWCWLHKTAYRKETIHS